MTSTTYKPFQLWTLASLVLAALVFLGGGVSTASAPAAPAAAASKPPSKADAEAVYARFQALEGAWIGRSTKGWTSRVTMETVAGGSAVVSRSFDDHPGETMLTLYHLDGERLMLTHYCVAENQPRMVLTSWDPSTGEAVFDFLDATGIASRDEGHMDRAVFRFDVADPSRMSSRWSWVEDGAEQWFEEIAYTRTPTPESTGAPGEIGG